MGSSGRFSVGLGGVGCKVGDASLTSSTGRRRRTFGLSGCEVGSLSHFNLSLASLFLSFIFGLRMSAD